MKNKTFVVAVVGPTASGKTALGIALAQHFGGEIVSCDSMQVYRGLSIGTAKPSDAEMRKIPHHLIGIVPVTQDFSLSDYILLAQEKIAEIRARGRLPVLVGGTGLYARALLQGAEFVEGTRDAALRQTLFLQAEAQPLALYQKLQAVDPAAAEKIHPNNIKRVVRALEYFQLTGKPISKLEQETNAREDRYAYAMLCLDFRDRQALYTRIDARVEQMLAQGLLKEAEAFYRQTQGLENLPTATQAIGYKELFPYFLGEITLEKAIANLKQATRNYAKRQLTWFRREKRAAVLHVDKYENTQALIQAAVLQIINHCTKEGIAWAENGETGLQ